MLQKLKLIQLTYRIALCVHRKIRAGQFVPPQVGVPFPADGGGWSGQSGGDQLVDVRLCGAEGQGGAQVALTGGKGESAAAGQVQLRRTAARRLPPRDQGALGQVPRPRHRDDHHQDWQVRMAHKQNHSIITFSVLFGLK